MLLRHYSWRTILSARPAQQRTQIHRQALMGTLPKNVHIMWESHSSRSYNALAASLSATFRVYRTISCASGLFNVVIQAEHNCVPPSDRRLRTSSLLTKKGAKKPATQRWGQAHLGEEIFLCPPPPTTPPLPSPHPNTPPPPPLLLFLFYWLAEKERFKG